MHAVRVYDMQLKVQRNSWVWTGDIILGDVPPVLDVRQCNSRDLTAYAHRNMPGVPALSSQSFLKKRLEDSAISTCHERAGFSATPSPQWHSVSITI